MHKDLCEGGGGEKNLIQKMNKNKHRELRNKNKVKELLICK